MQMQLQMKLQMTRAPAGKPRQALLRDRVQQPQLMTQQLGLEQPQREQAQAGLAQAQAGLSAAASTSP